MTQFIRVRSADGPAHEYDVSVDEAAANPESYIVIDDAPVDQPRPVNYVVAAEPAPAPAADAAPEPSVGDTTEEDA